jgi:hypothetical protein
MARTEVSLGKLHFVPTSPHPHPHPHPLMILLRPFHIERTVPIGTGVLHDITLS